VRTLTPPRWAMSAARTCIGVGFVTINPLVRTIMRKQIPADLRG